MRSMTPSMTPGVSLASGALPAYVTHRPGVVSRAITAENPDGAPNAGGTAASPLGAGRKGRPFVPLPAGGTLTLADIDGPGVIRHIWVTVPDQTPAGPYVLRDLTLTVHWDHDPQPAIQVPLGDFFGNGFATRAELTSAAMVVAPSGGMNCYLPMPFHRHATINITSDHPGEIPCVFFQIDYTLGDDLGTDVGLLHAQWRRTNATNAAGEDHVVLDGVTGTGSYVGTFIALTALERFWYGEGEMKFYLDGDQLPTICGTGLEDYVGGAWGFQDRLAADPPPRVITFSAPYAGYHQRLLDDQTRYAPYATPMPPSHAMYRWHLLDPILFHSDIRVTLQQIGHDGHRLFERHDDVATVAYWYQSSGETRPHPPLPPAARHPR